MRAGRENTKAPSQNQNKNQNQTEHNTVRVVSCLCKEEETHSRKRQHERTVLSDSIGVSHCTYIQNSSSPVSFVSHPVRFCVRTKWSGTVGSVKAHSPIRLRNGPLREPKLDSKVSLITIVSTFQFRFQFYEIYLFFCLVCN